MATVPSAGAQVGDFSGLANFGTDVVINGVATTRIREDTTSTWTNSSPGVLTIRDATLVSNLIGWSGNTGIGASEQVFEGINSVVSLTNTASTSNQRWQGQWVFDNHTFHYDNGTAATRYIIGGASDDVEWSMVVRSGGLNLVCYAPASLVLHGAAWTPVGTEINGPINLRGNVQAQASALVSLFGVVCAEGGSNESTSDIDSVYRADFAYNYRIAHQAGLSGSVTAINAGTGGRAILYTNFDMQNVVSAGRTTYDSDGVGTQSAVQTMLQLNRQVAWWMLDPIMGNQPGETLVGRSLPMGFHLGNPPGNGADASQDSEIRLFISDRPVYRNAANGLIVETDVRVNYRQLSTDAAALLRVLPDAWDPNVIPAQVDSGITTYFQTAGVADDNGVMLQVDHVHYGVGTGFDVNTNTTAGRNPTNNQIGAIEGKRRFSRSFEWDFIYETTIAPKNASSVDAATGLVDIAESRQDGSSVIDYLNGRTSTTALQSGITDLADVYPSLRRAWYEPDTLPGTFAVTTSGTSITFPVATTFETSGNSGSNANLITIGGSASGYTISGDNTTFVFGGGVDWNDQAIPSGLTVQGGFHAELPQVFSGATTFTGTVTLNINYADAGPITYATLIGDATLAGTITLTNTSGTNVDIQIDALPDGIILGTNFTRVDVPAGFIQRTIAPNVPAGADGIFIIANNDDPSAALIERTIQNGVLSGTDFLVVSTDTVNYTAYYKLDGAVTAGSSNDFSIVTRAFSAVGLTGDLTIEASPISPPFVIDASTPIATLTFQASTTDAIIGLWSASERDDPARGQGAVILSKNGAVWTRWHAANRFTVEYQQFTSTNFDSSWNNSVSGISGISETQGVIFAVPGTTQLTVVQQTGFNSTTATISASTVQGIQVGNASISTVSTAVAGTLRTVVDEELTLQTTALTTTIGDELTLQTTALTTVIGDELTLQTTAIRAVVDEELVEHATDIRAVVDEELKVGVLTNIGRP